MVFAKFQTKKGARQLPYSSANYQNIKLLDYFFTQRFVEESYSYSEPPLRESNESLIF